MSLLSAADRLGDYELLTPLARGGMAEVWAARHVETGSIVALKTILGTAVDEPQLVRMFEKETRLATQIEHPHVARVVGHGQTAGQHYLAMEWVHGEPLRHVLHEASKRNGLPLRVAVHIMAQACLGLHGAHEACSADGTPLGIVHRDVSPQNIIVAYEGSVKLVDFGVALSPLETESLTAPGELKGKLTFMSPEQVRERAMDRRSDIFSLGGLLYWAIAGRHPFRSNSARKTRDNLLNSNFCAPPSEYCASIPAALDAVVMKALASDPADRFSTAQQLHEALRAAVPEAFGPDGTAHCKLFLHDLFGPRSQARLAQLRFAQEVVDAMRDNSAPPASLGAVAVEPRKNPFRRSKSWRPSLPLWAAVGASAILGLCAFSLAQPDGSAGEGLTITPSSVPLARMGVNQQGLRSLRVLLLEDDPQVTTVCVRMLQRLGHEPVAVVKGEDALTAYRKAYDSATPFDVVLMDIIVRNGMGGVETLEHLLQLDQEVVAVATTGNSNCTLGELQGLGFTQSLPKPYRVTDMQNMLTALFSEGDDGL